MKLRKIFTLLLLVLVPLCVGAPAWADDGATDGEEGDRHLDIKSVSNEADDEYITYRIETYDEYHHVDDFSYFRWYFDTNHDGRFADLCIRLEQVGDGRLRAMLFPKCGPETWSTAEAMKVSDHVLEVKFPTRDFVVGGGIKPGEPFSYTVASEDLEGKTDLTPNRGSIEHSPLPEPASLYVTAPPGDANVGEGAEGGEGGEGAEEGGIESIPIVGGLANAIDNVPTPLLVLVILAAIGIVVGTVVVLRNQRSAGVVAVTAAAEAEPETDSPPKTQPSPTQAGAVPTEGDIGSISIEAEIHEATQANGRDADDAPPPTYLWGSDQSGGTSRVHTPDT